MFSELTDEERKIYMFGTFDNPPKLCPDYCEHLSITESEQNRRKDKPDHICRKYNVRIIHGPFHPKIMKCDVCISDEIMLNTRMNRLQSRHKRYLNKIAELELLPPTRARIKHLRTFKEKKFKAFHKFRFAVQGAVIEGYQSDWQSGIWYQR